MKDIGIRQLKAHASDLIRKVSEGNATYTITRRGRAVGVLAPPDFLAPSESAATEQAWERLMTLADKLDPPAERRAGSDAKSHKSAVRELERARR